MQYMSERLKEKACSLLVNQLKHEYSEKGWKWNDALSLAIEESINFLVLAAVAAVREELQVDLKWKA